MTDKYTISCVIPTCDRNDLLIESLYSILNQTHKPNEIIIVNNGREELVLPEPFTKVMAVHNIIPYAGVAQARNFGAILSSSNYLAFLDDDDLWPEDYLEKVSKTLVTSNAKCVISRMDKLENGKTSLLKNPLGQITINNILVRNPGCGGPNVVVNRQLFFESGGYDPKLPPSEDKALILEILLKGIEVTVLPENKVYVRMHDNNRLTDNAKLNEGIYQFTRKYRHLMNHEQYIFNVRKRMLNAYKNGNLLSGIKYYFVSFYIKIFRFIR